MNTEMYTVLIIEKDELVSAVIRLALENAGYKTIQATSWVEGVERLYEDPPEVIIITDEFMYLKEEPVFQNHREEHEISVIVLDGDPGKSVVMLEAGADVCMERPPSLKELIARVHSLLRHRYIHIQETSK